MSYATSAWWVHTGASLFVVPYPQVCCCVVQEQDTNFHYIALELCQATLLEYVEDWRFDRSQMDELTLLQQTMNGLNHLHSLGIGQRGPY